MGQVENDPSILLGKRNTCHGHGKKNKNRQLVIGSRTTHYALASGLLLEAPQVVTKELCRATLNVVTAKIAQPQLVVGRQHDLQLVFRSSTCRCTGPGASAH